PTAAQAQLDMEVENAAHYCQAIAQKLSREGLEVKATVERGDVLEKIKEFVRNRNVDCIAVGTHGRAGAQAFWEESLAAKLINSLDVSFLLANANK
ncbi:MAG: universal stress protein, partial [Chitinivibrionales bacterium]|nr:universal stress protein [Chitinivibrionales bacterium]